MRQNGGMTTPELAPRSPAGALAATWAFGAVAAILVGVFAPIEVRFDWMAIAAGAALVVAFAVNLRSGHADGFIVRTGASIAGALVLMGFISLGFTLAAIVPA